MCGIAGIISYHGSPDNSPRLKQMADTLRHRGPDGEGYWLNSDVTVGFAHRRLAIIDLSAAANQPFHYLHYTLIFNGEIYNYREIRSDLISKGYHFSSTSDTEVIAAAYDHWGEACLIHFDGMFAFALYNSSTDELLMARDRFGEKPLYYYASYAQRGRFDELIFASEIKALLAAGVQKKINGTMLLNYLATGYLQNPYKKTATFYNDILSLPPGHLLVVKPGEGKIKMKKWYALPGNILSQDTDAAEHLRSLFLTSVQRRLNSDVAVGTSLSGGLDSACVLAAIDALKKRDSINEHWKNIAFTAVFPGFEKDELEESKKVADHFAIQQFVVVPGATDCVELFNLFMHHQDEPVQSSSAFTQFMLYRLAAEKSITVLLDGQGADEILGGYTRFVPWHLQYLVRNNYTSFRKEKKLLQQNEFLTNWGKAHYAAAFFPEKTALALQQKAIHQVLRQPHVHPDFLHQYRNSDVFQKPVVRNINDLLYHSTFFNGLEELLRYADRNSMASSREVRLPFLYHTLVEFIFSLPPEMKIRDGFTKWLLRASMQSLLPTGVAWKKGKIGYEPPQQQWMQNKSMQEMIMESRRVLVKHGVLKTGVLEEPVIPRTAHDENNFDWRYLSSAGLLH